MQAFFIFLYISLVLYLIFEYIYRYAPENRIKKAPCNFCLHGAQIRWLLVIWGVVFKIQSNPNKNNS
jgi:uncharacterized BrkB/YihY/UPF0761 family membrane protein